MADRIEYLITVAVCALFAMVAQADDVSEFTAISAAAPAARERGDTAAYLGAAKGVSSIISAIGRRTVLMLGSRGGFPFDT